MLRSPWLIFRKVLLLDILDRTDKLILWEGFSGSWNYFFIS